MANGSEPTAWSPWTSFFQAAQQPGTYEHEILTRVLIAGAAVVATVIVMSSLSKQC